MGGGEGGEGPHAGGDGGRGGDLGLEGGAVDEGWAALPARQGYGNPSARHQSSKFKVSLSQTSLKQIDMMGLNH